MDMKKRRSQCTPPIPRKRSRKKDSKIICPRNLKEKKRRKPSVNSVTATKAGNERITAIK